MPFFNLVPRAVSRKKCEKRRREKPWGLDWAVFKWLWTMFSLGAPELPELPELRTLTKPTTNWLIKTRKLDSLTISETTDRIELTTRRTVVVWCYWPTTNNITTLLTNQGQSLTIYSSLWHSVTVINSPFHDYTLFSLLFIHWWLRHDSCNGVKRLLTIYMYNKMLTKAAHVKNCRLRIY